jgi:Crp-like helix-turn-helix domain
MRMSFSKVQSRTLSSSFKRGHIKLTVMSEHGKEAVVAILDEGQFLVRDASHGKEGNPPIVSVALSQGTLAEMIGTTRSRVSVFMSKFRKLGFIDYNVGFIDL